MKQQRETKKVIYNVHTLLADLKSCSMKRDLPWGRKIHAKAVEIRHDSNMHVVSALIKMYAKCGSMVDARLIFDSIQKPDVVCWTAVLLGYAENGDGLSTLELFSKMKTCGCAPDSVTYVAAIKACTSLAGKLDEDGKVECLKRGRVIHSEIGRNLDIFVQGTLIDMYAKCGSMVEARSVFESISKPNVVCWTTLLLGYADNGDGLATLEMFSKMKSSGCTPDSVTYIAALKACTSLAETRNSSEWLKRGKEIHSEIGCHFGIFLQNTLIDMYAKCRSMRDARRVFDSIQRPDVVSWNALLLGYVENGDGHATLELFSRMKACGCAPDPVTYVAALKACTYLAGDRDGGGQGECLNRGRQIHSEIGCNLDIFVQSTLIDMYAKCNSVVDARRVFDDIQKPNVVCWTALLWGYAEAGDGLTTLVLFSKMKACGCVPNSMTCVAALKACGLVGAVALGRKLHSEIREFNAHVVTCLVDFYAKCASIVEACEVFDLHSTARVVSTWNALLAGYSSFGDTDSMFNIFEAMQDQGFQPDAITFVCMLSCFSHAGLVDKAREYFEAMPMQYGVTPTLMHYTCMVDVLGRANQLDEAIDVLQKMPYNPDAVTWMTLLGACRKWKNVEIGKCAFQSLVDLDKKNASAYALMAHIYRSRSMWEEQEMVLEKWIKIGTKQIPGQAYVINEVGHMVKFGVGEKDHPEIKSKLEQLLEGMKEHGYGAEWYNATHNISTELCSHSERRAVVYGILITPFGEPVRAFKNMRMCDDCHGATKMISKLSGRVIMVRDASRFHVMVNGSCSCGDYW